MPIYEYTMFIRSLAKPELSSVIVRNVRKMLDHGVVVKKIESLGHNDFPFSLTKNGEKHYHGNRVLVHCVMPESTVDKVMAEARNDEDVVKAAMVSEQQARGDEWMVGIPRHCTLADDLKPASERESVRKLREGQKMNKLSKFLAYNNAQMSYRRVPKSFFIQRPPKKRES